MSKGPGNARIGWCLGFTTLIAALLLGCGSGTERHPLVGVWQLDRLVYGDHTIMPSADSVTLLTFSPDHRYEERTEYQGEIVAWNRGTYSVDGLTLTRTPDHVGEPKVYRYSVSGDELQLVLPTTEGDFWFFWARQ